MKLQKKERNLHTFPCGRSHKDQIDEARFFNEKTHYKARHSKKAFKQWKNGVKVTSKYGALEVGNHIDSCISSHYGFNL